MTDKQLLTAEENESEVLYICLFSSLKAYSQWNLNFIPYKTSWAFAVKDAAVILIFSLFFYSWQPC